MTVCIFDVGDYGEKTSYIDKDAYDYICNNYPNKWFINKGYLVTHKGKKTYKIHILVFEANNINISENKEIDHISRNRLDNTLENLRIVNRSINNYNRTKKENTTSKYLGVTWDKSKSKYKARIRIKGKEYHLGYYENELYAAYAYNVAKKHLLDNDKSNYNIIDKNLIDGKTKMEIRNKVLSIIN